MNTFTATIQFQRTFNLQPPIVGLELPVLTPEGPRKARIVSTEPDGSGSGYGWQIVLEDKNLGRPRGLDLSP